MNDRIADVQRGAQLLDQDKPDWAKDITRPINMSSHDDCVLGQVYGNFRTGMEHLELNFLDDHRFGFHSSIISLLGILIFRNPWKRLEVAWRIEIDTRQSQVA